MSNQSENKRIAYNSLFLFARMFVTLIIGLYTSRVLLSALGVSDYGIYNVVGSVVIMFSFINTAMVNSTQRFVTYELGKKDEKKLNRVFSTSINIHAIISFLIIIVSETVGVWYLNNKMVIPADRLVAANWVFQFSLLSSVVGMMNAPFSALIVAHEKMSAFAYMSLMDAILKLLIAYLIIITDGDRLIFYGLFLLIINVLERFVYVIYCKKKFTESKYHWCWDKKLYGDMSKFALFNFFGNFSYACYTQGLNLLLNVFFTPAVNAARGIAVQVQNAICNFSYNIEYAIKPQITITYSQNKIERMHALISLSARISFYALLIISVPILLETDQILMIWLNDVPEYAASFIRFSILIAWIEAMANPLQTAVQATGNIKRYQIIIGFLTFSILPLSYIALLFIQAPVVVYVVSLLFEIFIQVIKVVLVGNQINLAIKNYFVDVFLRTLMVAIIALVLVYPIYYFLNESLSRIIIVTICSCLIICILVFLIGLKKPERAMVNKKIEVLILKLKNK